MYTPHLRGMAHYKALRIRGPCTIMRSRQSGMSIGRFPLGRQAVSERGSVSRPKQKRRPKQKKRAQQKRRAQQKKRTQHHKRRSKQKKRAQRKTRPAPRSGGRSPAPLHLPDPTRPEPGVATWVPPGGRIVVQGRSIEGGMVYVGSEVLSVSGHWTEPCLIDPDLPVNWRQADRDGATLDEWPSYSQIDPRARAGYLAWLAGGRSDELAHIGFVLLFFYGLERRLLVDIGSDLDHPDVGTIVAEIIRLLILYGANDLFSSYANSLLALVEALFCRDTDIEPIPWDTGERDGENPLAVLIGIGKSVANGSRIPAEWALRYLHHHPETRLRTAAKRCPDEFDELFMARYRARFRGGMKARRPARDLHLLYPAASHGFSGLIVFPWAPSTPELAGDFELGDDGVVSILLDGIPDITTTPSVIRKLWGLAEECTDELDTYSRFIGKNPDGAQTAAAISLLPDVLLASRGGGIIDDLRDWMSEMLGGRPSAVVPLDELVNRWAPGRTGKLTKRDAERLASLLGKLGVGMEPDVRFGAPIPRPGTSAVLFPLPAGAADAPSAAYTEAMPLAHLAAVVAGADGSISPDQRRFVVDHLEEVHGLDTAERRRVRSHLEFLTTGRLGMYGVKRKVEALPAESRTGVGRFLVALATADGVASGAEVSALEKMYGYLGLDEADVYRHLHGLEIGEPGPVVVRDAQPATRRAVPERDTDAAPLPSIALDLAKVQARLAETDRVSALLTDIFVDDDPPPETESRAPGPEPGSMIEGLDGPHSQLLAALTARSEWDRGSVEELARSFGLPFPDGALDVINETAIDVCGEPVVEGADPVVLNPYALEELT